MEAFDPKKKELKKAIGLRTAGKFPMMIGDWTKKDSAAGNPMLTLLWESLDPANPGAVRDHLVMNNKYGPAKFTKYKIMAGLDPLTGRGEDLVGLKAMVTLKLKAPDKDGKVFSEIVEVEKFEPNWKAERASEDFLAPPKPSSTVIDF